jgi:hypothetical protein
MTRKTFEREMKKAKMFAYLGGRADYWHGYQWGLRRAYHGEAFGTEGERDLWMSLADEVDESRRECGLGYRDGLAV